MKDIINFLENASREELDDFARKSENMTLDLGMTTEDLRNACILVALMENK
jgi:hypothetical protein